MIVPGQRWVSDSEPEMGLGIILKVEHATVEILFPAAEETRCYALESAPLRRVIFKKGELIVTHEEEEYVVNAVKESAGLVTYLTDDAEIPEAMLSDHTGFNKPQDRLFGAQVDENSVFRLRAEALYRQHQIRNLLMDGIGDTIRISLAADPVEEVKVGFDILKSLKLRSNGINFIACPSCSRQNFDVVGTMNALEQRLEDIRTPMDVAVIGCIVNGPGEAREADIGLTGATPNNLIYVDGEPDHKISNEGFIDHLEEVIRDKASKLEQQRALEAEKLILKTTA